MEKNTDIDQFKKGSCSAFKIPEGYFNDLPGKISERISSPEKITAPARFFQIAKPHLALAGGMISLFILLWMGLSWFDSMPGTYVKPNTEMSELANMDEYGFDEAMIVEAMVDTVSFSENSLWEEDIIDYLLLEEADISSLLIEM